MNLSQYLKPAGTVIFVVALGVGYYLFEHRHRAEPKETPSEALVIVTKSTNACFSDLVRVTGFFVPRREAVVVADQEGSRVTDLFVTEGTLVTDNQELARLTAPPQIPGQPPRPGPQGPVSLKASAPGLVTEVRTIVGAPASPQAGPMFRIAVNNEIELDAQVPAVHMAKLSSGATVRISRDDAPDLIGRVRLVAPENRSRHPARPRAHQRHQQSLAESRRVRPRLDRRQAKLRRRGSQDRDRPSHRAGRQEQHCRDAQGTGRAVFGQRDGNPGRPQCRRDRRRRRRLFAA
ncbi:hypothetical protein ACVWZV_002008 [Bradyrhizobium sp. GM5.1]